MRFLTIEPLQMTVYAVWSFLRRSQTRWIKIHNVDGHFFRFEWLRKTEKFIRKIIRQIHRCWLRKSRSVIVEMWQPTPRLISGHIISSSRLPATFTSRSNRYRNLEIDDCWQLCSHDNQSDVKEPIAQLCYVSEMLPKVCDFPIPLFMFTRPVPTHCRDGEQSIGRGSRFERGELCRTIVWKSEVDFYRRIGASLCNLERTNLPNESKKSRLHSRINRLIKWVSFLEFSLSLVMGFPKWV
jgi:hypothetical protein